MLLSQKMMFLFASFIDITNSSLNQAVSLDHIRKAE